MSKESSFKGHPTICLDADSKYPFSFGLGKAKLILAHIEQIKAFVAKHDRPSGGDRFDMAVEDQGKERCGL